ncbi:hypothetical protein JCGZ_04648 [Jatropha curcas]|uniref:Uncharacterized protein n=1 Tax=Jatropha curcas TaxID=180498 RepID=A0A067L0I2_JATCU|nr:hypothetical protein JCGZ_04648 [Jatropha curcas]
MKGLAFGGIYFGKYALQALEPALLTANHIRAGRDAITKNAPRERKIWIRIFPDHPLTVKPAGTRMGRGKGSFKCLAADVKPGTILYEVDGVAEKVAKKAISVAASKIPIRTRFVISK